MDKRFQYREKNVRDISSAEGIVRVWDASKDLARKSIEEAYEELFRSGFIYPYVALMPDHHPGEGSMVGSVIPTREVLLPSVIGGTMSEPSRSFRDPGWPRGTSSRSMRRAILFPGRHPSHIRFQC